MRMSMDWSQHVTGVDFHSLEKLNVKVTHLEDNWLGSVNEIFMFVNGSMTAQSMTQFKQPQ